MQLPKNSRDPAHSRIRDPAYEEIQWHGTDEQMYRDSPEPDLAGNSPFCIAVAKLTVTRIRQAHVNVAEGGVQVLIKRENGLKNQALYKRQKQRVLKQALHVLATQRQGNVYSVV